MSEASSASIVDAATVTVAVGKGGQSRSGSAGHGAGARGCGAAAGVGAHAVSAGRSQAAMRIPSGYAHLNLRPSRPFSVLVRILAILALVAAAAPVHAMDTAQVAVTASIVNPCEVVSTDGDVMLRCSRPHGARLDVVDRRSGALFRRVHLGPMTTGVALPDEARDVVLVIEF